MSAEATQSTDVQRSTRAVKLAGCLQRARNGDLTALDEVVRELNGMLWSVARAQSLTADQAADVVQTTWLALLGQLHDIRVPEALTAWLVTTTRREAWRVRVLQRRQLTDDFTAVESVSASGLELDERLLSDERDQILWRHLRRLSARCRELLRMVAENDRPDYSAVSEALGMPHGSIGPTRSRCLAKLREMLLTDSAWTAS